MEDKQLVKKINQLVEGQIITQEDGTESVLLINKANHNHVLLFTVYDGTIYLNGTGLDEANRTVGYKGYWQGERYGGESLDEIIYDMFT